MTFSDEEKGMTARTLEMPDAETIRTIRGIVTESLENLNFLISPEGMDVLIEGYYSISGHVLDYPGLASYRYLECLADSISMTVMLADAIVESGEYSRYIDAYFADYIYEAIKTGMQATLFPHARLHEHPNDGEALK